MNKPTLVLASTSRYRKMVLEKLGVPFKTVRPEVDETPLANETAIKLVTRLSELKARAVITEFSNALIIGSDQVAVLDEKILGKPGNYERAHEQLRLLSGNTVIFHTGLCLLNSATGTTQIEVVDYKVNFRDLSDSEIEHYLKQDEPYDSAGSFKSEGLGIALFKSMTGEDPNALIGLPLIKLTTMLKNENFSVL